MRVPPHIGGAAWLISTIVLVFYIVVGATAIVGGIYALRRSIWGLALAGSICTLILEILVPVYWVDVFGEGFYNFWTFPFIAASVPFGIPGILAIIFIVKGKREFK